jgi:hypothetical protein
LLIQVAETIPPELHDAPRWQAFLERVGGTQEDIEALTLVLSAHLKSIK